MRLNSERFREDFRTNSIPPDRVDFPGDHAAAAPPLARSLGDCLKGRRDGLAASGQVLPLLLILTAGGWVAKRRAAASELDARMDGRDAIGGPVTAT